MEARAEQIVDRNPGRRLFQPQRIAHQQPVAPPVQVNTTRPAAGARARSRAVTPAQSVWESAWSDDHSEWEQAWWLDDDSNVPTPAPPTPRARSPAPPPIVDAPVVTGRELRIAEAMQHLRDNHECDHDKWRFVKGRNSCEECRHVLREYIFECKQCHLRKCNRCRRNQL